MRILGIDPGLAILGWGIIDSDRTGQKLVEYGCIYTSPDECFPDRLKHIAVDMRALLAAFHPDQIVYEELFFARNVTTALNVAAARGVSLSVCAEYTRELYEYTPMQIKQAITGWGRAEKLQIQQMVKLLLKLDHIPKPDDAADAIAIALTHAAAGPAGAQFRMK